MAYQRKAGDKITFWKINHPPEDFSYSEWQDFLKKKIVVIKGKSELEKFTAIRIGDYFYLHQGNTQLIKGSGIKLVGRIIDEEPKPYPNNIEFWQRRYEMIFPTDGISLNEQFYSYLSKSYTPNFVSKEKGSKTLYEIPKSQATEFERAILQSFFGVDIKMIFLVISTVIIATIE